MLQSRPELFGSIKRVFEGFKVTSIKVLLAEDDVLVRFVMAEELRDIGWEVTEVGTADEGIQVIRSRGILTSQLPTSTCRVTTMGSISRASLDAHALSPRLLSCRSASIRRARYL